MKQPSRAKMYEKRLAEAREGWKPRDYSLRQLIPDNKIMVLADVHLPRHDERLLAEAFTRAEDERVDSIVFLGDLMDNPTWSTWGRDDWSDNFERELRLCETVIKCALEAANYVYWSFGNHEGRFMRAMQSQISMEHLAKLAGLGSELASGALIVSDNPTLDAFDGTWMLTHPKVYGRQPLVEPGKLATRFQQNIVAAHAHHYAAGLDETGKFQVIESGGLFKPEYHQYINYNVTSHRSWVQGYWILDGGEPRGFRPTQRAAKKVKGLLERLAS